MFYIALLFPFIITVIDCCSYQSKVTNCISSFMRYDVMSVNPETEKLLLRNIQISDSFDDLRDNLTTLLPNIKFIYVTGSPSICPMISNGLQPLICEPNVTSNICGQTNNCQLMTSKLPPGTSPVTSSTVAMTLPLLSTDVPVQTTTTSHDHTSTPVRPTSLIYEIILKLRLNLSVKVTYDNPSLWWLDATAHFSALGLPNVSVIESPIMLFDHAGHSIFTATHPDMFQYLHLSLNRSQTLTMFGSGLIYLRGTIAVKRDVMRWWVLCALEADCMALKQSRLRCTQERRYDQYANCHRFDQSAINTILANLFNYETTKYRFADTVAVSGNNSFPFISREGANDENDLKNLIASVKRHQSTMTTGTQLASLQQRQDE